MPATKQSSEQMGCEPSGQVVCAKVVCGARRRMALAAAALRSIFFPSAESAERWRAGVEGSRSCSRHKRSSCCSTKLWKGSEHKGRGRVSQSVISCQALMPLRHANHPRTMPERITSSHINHEQGKHTHTSYRHSHITLLFNSSSCTPQPTSLPHERFAAPPKRSNVRPLRVDAGRGARGVGEQSSIGACECGGSAAFSLVSSSAVVTFCVV